ncbi:MAG: CoA pyrophosphatase, partial [Bacteroidales bacterium]
MRISRSWIEKLEARLKKPLPGDEAHNRMSPAVRRPVMRDIPIRNSGVLLLLYPAEKTAHTIFIKRSEYEGIHSGQVSLPGGMYRTDDGNTEQTALREAGEEIGIQPNRVSIIGSLSTIHIPVSNVNVFPYVGTMPLRPNFRHDPREVQYIIETSLERLMDSQTCKSEIINIAGVNTPVPYYDIQGHHVWGATAMIVCEFLEVCREIV